jgi:predicted nucleotidyltransferase
MPLINKSITDYAFFNSLATLPFVERIIVYGSRARGDHQERSDIDLAISCPNASQNNWNTITEIIEEADTLLKIDCVRLEDLADVNPLRQSIIKEGKVLFEKSHH